MAQLLGNLSRVWFNRRELDLPVVGWFALTGVPAALVGGFLFASAPLPFLTRFLGIFLISVVVYRRAGSGSGMRLPLRAFAIVGAVFSFLVRPIGKCRTDHDSFLPGVWAYQRRSHLAPKRSPPS